MRNSPPKVGVSFLHDFPDSTLALILSARAKRKDLIAKARSAELSLPCKVNNFNSFFLDVLNQSRCAAVTVECTWRNALESICLETYSAQRGESMHSVGLLVALAIGPAAGFAPSLLKRHLGSILHAAKDDDAIMNKYSSTLTQQKSQGASQVHFSKFLFTAYLSQLKSYGLSSTEN